MMCHKIIGFAILCLVLIQLGSVAASGCKDNFTAVAGKCLLASKKYMNWFDAERYCRTLGAGLLSLQNQSQLIPIQNFLNDELTLIKDVWTSGNSLGQKGTFFWQSTGQMAEYLPWSMSEPSKIGECLVFNDNNFNSWSEYKYRLSVEDCSERNPFVCEQLCF